MNTEQERVELLPCPFCGSANSKLFGQSAPEWWVVCLECWSSSQTTGNKDKAIAAWNRRAALQSQTIPASDWFDMFMELARAVVVANRLFAVSPTTTKQKVAADAAIALQEHARKHPALQSQDREDAERLDWLEEQAQSSRTGVSIDYVYDAEDGYVNEKGYRFMRYRFIGPLGRSAREAIDHARRTEGET